MIEEAVFYIIFLLLGWFLRDIKTEEIKKRARQLKESFSKRPQGIEVIEPITSKKKEEEKGEELIKKIINDSKE